MEDEILLDPVDAPEVVDDFELGDEDTVDIKDREVNKQKLRRRIDQFKVTTHVLCDYGLCILEACTMRTCVGLVA